MHNNFKAPVVHFCIQRIYACIRVHASITQLINGYQHICYFDLNPNVHKRTNAHANMYSHSMAADWQANALVYKNHANAVLA